MLKFTKMHGIGNDFVVINCLDQVFTPTKEVIQNMSQRNTGIGCDQVLLIEPNVTQGIDFKYRIFNSNGNEVEHCGNGARCVIKYLIERKISDKSVIKLQTKTSVITGLILENGKIQVNMGMPLFEPSQIPFLGESNETNNYHIIVAGQLIKFGIVSMGNPHAVIQMSEDELQNIIKLEKIAHAIQNAHIFPNGVNISFYNVRSPHEVVLRTYERGCGFTAACGTGACAVVAYNILQDNLDYSQPIKVVMSGGVLLIAWNKLNEMQMSGDAITIFDGEIDV